MLLADSANNWIRFVPASNYYGTIDPGLTFRAWDCSASGSSGAIGVDVSTNGGTTAFSTATETASLTVNPVNDPPSITDIPDQTTPMNQPIGPVIFAVSDVDNPLPSLTISASSSDPGLVPNANILLSGNDANRTITITPQASQIGTTTITVAVSDGMVTVYETFAISITGAKVYLPMVQK